MIQTWKIKINSTEQVYLRHTWNNFLIQQTTYTNESVQRARSEDRTVTGEVQQKLQPKC